jgi:nucleoid DNA-binding protein
MSLDKNMTIAEVGRRTRLRNHDVQKMLEALVEVWSEELADGGRIELENFLVLEVKQIDRGENMGALLVGGKLVHAPRSIWRLLVRPSKALRRKLRDHLESCWLTRFVVNKVTLSGFFVRFASHNSH